MCGDAVYEAPPVREVCGCTCICIVRKQESGVGKTCLVNRFVSDVFTENESLTVG